MQILPGSGTPWSLASWAPHSMWLRGGTDNLILLALFKTIKRDRAIVPVLWLQPLLTKVLTEAIWKDVIFFFFPDGPCVFSEKSCTHETSWLIAQASQEELDGRVLELHRSWSLRKKRWFPPLNPLNQAPHLCAQAAGPLWQTLASPAWSGCRHGSEPALWACFISYCSSKPITEFTLVRSNCKTNSCGTNKAGEKWRCSFQHHVSGQKRAKERKKSRHPSRQCPKWLVWMSAEIRGTF